MEVMIWIGAAISALGLVGILWVAAGVMRARRAGLEDAELRARLQRAIAWNLGAFLLSAVGLMLVVLGIILR